ncbi:hypothetical protein Goklo_029526, partial [Gossypium klotzschianum]|nr:hypothetical protein [Gossypium klotzschianum]
LCGQGWQALLWYCHNQWTWVFNDEDDNDLDLDKNQEEGPNGNASKTNFPLAAGILASGLFMLFPTKRRGFGEESPTEEKWWPKFQLYLTVEMVDGGILISQIFDMFFVFSNFVAMALLLDSSKQSLLPTFLYSSPNSFSLDRFHDANNSAFAASHESLDANNLLNLEFPFSKFNLVNNSDAKDGFGRAIDGKILGMEKK